MHIYHSPVTPPPLFQATLEELKAMHFIDYISGQLQLQTQEPCKVTGLQFFNSVLYNADNPVCHGSFKKKNLPTK